MKNLPGYRVQCRWEISWEAIEDQLFTRKWYQGHAYDPWEGATKVYYLVPLHLTVKIGRWLLKNYYYRLLKKLVKWDILIRQDEGQSISAAKFNIAFGNPTRNTRMFRQKFF